MQNDVISIIEQETYGTRFNARKVSLDDFPSEIEVTEDNNDSITWKKIGETEPQKGYINLTRESLTLENQEDNILTYFLDGSRQVSKASEIVYVSSDGRSEIYPIIIGQIGVGCCKRENKILKPEELVIENVISLPDISNVDRKRGFFEGLVTKINKESKLKKFNLNISSILPYMKSKANRNSLKYESLGIACVQSRMLEKEKEVVQKLVKNRKLNQDNYLVKDGSIEYRPSPEIRNNNKLYERFKQNYNWVIGVSKSFNPSICLDIRDRPNPGFIANLPLFHRTPVACYEYEEYFGEIQFAVWYIRIRESNYSKSPFDGVIKVEKILVTEEEKENGIDTNLVNILSANLIRERNPVCYGNDSRWANHLYPIYLTESYIKSHFISRDTYMNIF